MKLLILLFCLNIAFGFQFPFLTTSESVSSCGEEGDIFTYKSLDFTPDPPQKGKTLNFLLTGFLNEPIEEGSIVHIKVKLGFIGLLDTDMNLCEQIRKINRNCPMPKGPLELNHTVDLPSQMPSGRYSIVANARTADSMKLESKHIACLKANFKV